MVYQVAMRILLRPINIITALKQFVEKNCTREADGFQEGLGDAEIECVMQDYYKIPKKQYTIIPNMVQFNTVQCGDLPALVQGLRDNTVLSHIFIVGNMKEIEYGPSRQQRGTFDHWTAAVAFRRAGKTKLFIADSLRDTHTNPALIQRLAQLLATDPKELRVLPDFDHRISTARDVLSINHNYVGCLYYIKRIITDLKDQNMLASHTFNVRYLPLIEEMLHQLIGHVSSVHATEAIALMQTLNIKKSAIAHRKYIS